SWPHYGAGRREGKGRAPGTDPAPAVDRGRGGGEDRCAMLNRSALATAMGPLRQALDLVLPPRCLGCGALVERQGALCAPCWAAVTFVAEPLCRHCGLPFAFDPDSGPHRSAGEDYACGACLAEPPPFERARAVMRYDDASRPLLLGFKHGDRTEAAPP